MGLFQKYFVDVRHGTKITYSESDLRKLDRNYEREVLPQETKRVRSPLRKMPQKAYLTQIRDYAFERILDNHMYTFQHILVVPNPYDLVKQSALLLFNSSKETKIRYRVLGDTPDVDFTGETGYTTRHRVPVVGLYLKRSNKVELEMLDLEGNVVKRRMLRIYVSDKPKRLEGIKMEKIGKNLPYFPYIMINSVSGHPFAVDPNGDIRYSIQLWTTTAGMIPLANGHFLYEDREANRMGKNGRIISCQYHEMDYLGRVYRTFLMDYPVVRAVAQNGKSLYLVASLYANEKKRQLLELDLESGRVKEISKVPRLPKDTPFGYIDLKSRRKAFGKAVESADGKVTLSCNDLKEKAKLDGGVTADIRKGMRTELVETEKETGEVLGKWYLNRPVTKVWLFEPDILSFCRPVEVTPEVVFGEVAPPAEFGGSLPNMAEEPLGRANFGNVFLCGELLIGYILPGCVSRIYLVGKKHSYVQDYQGMKTIYKRKFPLAISLKGLASDEYHVFVESQDVVHQLKHEIRVTDKER